MNPCYSKNSPPMLVAPRTTGQLLLALLLPIIALAGCAPQHYMRATDYHINVHLDPAEHTIVARAIIQLQAMGEPTTRGGEVWVGFDLNKDLTVSDVQVEGARLRRTGSRAARDTSKDHSRPPNHRQHLLYLDRAPSFLTVTLDYYGTLHQDVQAGEQAGQIHNFEMSAHISPEGTYLAPDGHWYPSPVFQDEDQIDPALFLADWHIQADRIDDYELAAGAFRQDDDPQHYLWVSPHKLSSMTVVGGPHQVWSRQAGDVEIRVHLQPGKDPAEQAENEKIANRYLDETAAYIERYTPLLGPFPYRQYTIVENFFSSGFAFPMMTLFGPTVMRMGDNSFRHGYLDHELVHSWWGCAVDVDHRDGNWCEALTTYCTNYYGFVLDGDQAGARKKRRNNSNFLSRVTPDKDKPLGTYGLDDGAGRGIAYNKGAAVFHMLARQIGQDKFWQACREFSGEFWGRHANWDDLKRVFEEAGGRNMDEFFQQWIRGGGAPSLTLSTAQYDQPGGHLLVQVDQGNQAFSLDLPLRIYYGDGQEDVIAAITSPTETVAVPVTRAPRSVELDPDYHVFRKVKPSEIMPTTATTKSAKLLTIVKPSGQLLEPYNTVAASFEKAVKSGKKHKGKVVTIIADDDLSPEMLNQGGVLLLGNAVRHPVVQELLSRTRCPIAWSADGFAVDQQQFNSPKHAVLCTVHHPDSPTDGITVYAGNSEDALANAAILGYYANSLLVFEANGRTKVVLRRDFEFHQRVEVVPQ